MSEKEIAHRLLRLRLPGETQIEFAHRLKLTQASVSRYLRGTKPNREALVKIAKRTGASLDWLLTGKGASVVAAPVGRVAARVTRPRREEEWLEAALSYLDNLSSLTRTDREALKALIRDGVKNPGRLRQILNHWEAM